MGDQRRVPNPPSRRPGMGPLPAGPGTGAPTAKNFQRVAAPKVVTGLSPVVTRAALR